jgi:hypothetical protein
MLAGYRLGGECRRRAPVHTDRFPLIAHSDWCGEWEQRPAQDASDRAGQESAGS